MTTQPDHDDRDRSTERSEQRDELTPAPATSGHSDAGSQAQRNTEDESPG